LSSADQGTWAWRTKLAWTLVGPSVVLLIQVEAVLVIADALGALGLRVDAARRTAAIAFAALLLVTAAQLATGLWRRTRDARKILLDRRLKRETQLQSAVRPRRIDIEADPSEPHYLKPSQPQPAPPGGDDPGSNA
jgi:hypothetical protein